MQRQTDLQPKARRDGRGMDWNIIEGKWKELKGTAREEWGRLTHDELEEIGARRIVWWPNYSRSTDTPPTRLTSGPTSGQASGR